MSGSYAAFLDRKRRVVRDGVIRLADGNHALDVAESPSQSEHARCHFGKMEAAELDSFRLEAVALREQKAVGF